MLIMLSMLSWLPLLVGSILIVYSFVSFRRKGESEISESAVSMTQFKIGVVLAIITIIIKIVAAFM